MIIALTRSVILYFLIMLGLRLMGKRQIGELEPSELVLTMMISDLAAVPMQDYGIPLLAGIVPIVTLLSLAMLLSYISLQSLRFRELVYGPPSILIDEGRICQAAMRKNRYTLDELLEELREQGISCIEDVKYAVLENSGRLSILPWSQCTPPDAKTLGIKKEDTVTLPIVLINDGRILQKNLAACGRDLKWLQQLLEKEQIASPAQVFLLTLDQQGKTVCIKKEASS